MYTTGGQIENNAINHGNDTIRQSVVWRKIHSVIVHLSVVYSAIVYSGNPPVTLACTLHTIVISIHYSHDHSAGGSCSYHPFLSELRCKYTVMQSTFGTLLTQCTKIGGKACIAMTGHYTRGLFSINDVVAPVILAPGPGHFSSQSYWRPVILAPGHFSVRLFGVLLFWLPGILAFDYFSVRSFWPPVILALDHFGARSFWHLAILAFDHFGVWSFWLPVIIASGQFSARPFWRPVILGPGHFCARLFSRRLSWRRSFWACHFGATIVAKDTYMQKCITMKAAMRVIKNNIQSSAILQLCS